MSRCEPSVLPVVTQVNDFSRTYQGYKEEEKKIGFIYEENHKCSADDKM